MSYHKNYCPFCKSPNYKYIISQTDLRFFPKDVFQICRCKNCNILFTLPIFSLEQLHKYYPKSYGAYLEVNSIDKLFKQTISTYKKFYSKFLLYMEGIYSRSFYKEIWSRYPKKIFFIVPNSIIRMYYKVLALLTFKYSRFLDPLRVFGLAKYPSALPYNKQKVNYLHIGSGSAGLFSRLLIQGFTVYNIDINKELCDVYRKKGIKSHFGTIEDTNFPPETFDLIYFSHVIEHLLNPKEELAKLKEWLKKDGVIVCQFPLYGTVEWNSNKKYVFFDVPRHRIHIEKNNIEKIFDTCGLKIKKSLFPPYGWGLFFTDFIYNFKKFGKKLKEKFTSKYFRRSLMLSFSKESGNLCCCLTRK